MKFKYSLKTNDDNKKKVHRRRINATLSHRVPQRAYPENLKPVIILIQGFSSSPLWWKYKDIGKSKLEKIDFLAKLGKLGDVYEHKLLSNEYK